MRILKLEKTKNLFVECAWKLLKPDVKLRSVLWGEEYN